MWAEQCCGYSEPYERVAMLSKCTQQQLAWHLPFSLWKQNLVSAIPSSEKQMKYTFCVLIVASLQVVNAKTQLSP